MPLLHQLRDSDEAAPASAVGLFVLRAATGLLIFVVHGWHKLEGGLAYLRQGTAWRLAEEVAGMGTPAPVAAAFAATLVQFVCALLLLVGWHTRLNAALLTAVLAGAILQNLQTGRDPQLALLYTLVTAAYVLIGGGRFSLDARRAGAARP